MRRTTLRKYKKQKTFKKQRGGRNFIDELNIIVDTGIQQGQNNNEIRDKLYSFFIQIVCYSLSLTILIQSFFF